MCFVESDITVDCSCGACGLRSKWNVSFVDALEDIGGEVSLFLTSQLPTSHMCMLQDSGTS